VPLLYAPPGQRGHLAAIDLMSADIDGGKNLTSFISFANEQNSVLPINPDAVGAFPSRKPLEI
jgi:hypothetical protein